jgi:DnaJ-class molecular chaperone with C-terminal Zn finger domain
MKLLRRKRKYLVKDFSPKSVKKVPGEGMPIHNEKINAKNFNKPLEKGDLYIKFDIVFPKTLTEEQKLEIKKNLPS